MRGVSDCDGGLSGLVIVLNKCCCEIKLVDVNSDKREDVRGATVVEKLCENDEVVRLDIRTHSYPNDLQIGSFPSPKLRKDEV